MALLCATLLLAVPRTTHASAILRVPEDYPTIQAALDSAVTGDSVLVAQGVYDGPIKYNGRSVTVESANGPDRTLLTASNATVVDIGPGGALSGFTISGGAGYVGGGISVHGDGSLITGNVLENNTQYYGGFGAAIGGNNASPTIERNIFRRNNCQGDTQFPAGVVAFVNVSSPRIQNNLFVDNLCRALNLTLPTDSHPTVVNNTIARNPVGIHVDARVPTLQQTYRNNLLVDNGIGLEVVFGSASHYPTWDHNLAWGNGTNYVGIPDPTGVSGNLSTDPMVASSGTSDFHLTRSSAAIDSGSDTLAPAEDFDGRLRPLDGNLDGSPVSDIGAYEFCARPARGQSSRDASDQSFRKRLRCNDTRD